MSHLSLLSNKGWVGTKVIDTGNHLQHYVIIVCLTSGFQQAWYRRLGKTVSADICFNSRKSLLSDNQTMCRYSQCSVISLGMSTESKSLLLTVWWHKGWLVGSYRNISSEVEESFSGDIFSNRLKHLVSRYNSYCLHLLRVYCEEIALVETVFIFVFLLLLIEAVRPLWYWRNSSFYWLWDKRGRIQVHCVPCDYLKSESLWVPEGADLRFRRINSNAFGQSIWGVLYKFCQLNLYNAFSSFAWTRQLRVVSMVKVV